MKQKLNTEREQLVKTAYALFFDFRNAYQEEWRRLENCERMYRGDHWHDVPLTDPNEPRPVTPILQSTIENVQADLLELMPEAVIQPESGKDRRTAQIVEAVIRRNHDASAYPVEYQKLVHDLLVGGYCVQEVGYEPSLNGGLGGAFIRQVDTRSILFDPLVSDIQQGRAVFKFSLRTRDWLAAHYPDNAPFMEHDMAVCDAPEDEIMRCDRRDTLLMLEYWWRQFDPKTEQSSVHMALICGGQLLSDSRTQKPDGYFAHGQYPFEITPLFPRKGSALGFGLVDLFETQQRYADKLDQIVLKNAFMASHNKLLITEASGFDSDDLRDWSKDVHTGESLNGVTWFSTPPLPAYLLSYIQQMRESIKEESGANDSSRGNTHQGVTAASAITALQEASTKRARMAATQLYESYRRAVRMEIEVEREFNYFLRPVTIITNGRSEEVLFDSAELNTEGIGGVELPIEFYISIKAARQNRFAAAAQNELMLKLMQAGALTPNQAVELMLFDGKDQVLKQMNQGGNQ